MRWPIIWTLYRKEMLETLRDRRTIIVMVLLPILMYPLFGVIATQAQFAQKRKLESTRFKIGVVGVSLPQTLVKKLEEQDSVIVLSSKAGQGWRSELQQGKLALVVVATPDKQPITHPQGRLKLHVYYASTQERSRAVRERVQNAFRWYQKQLVLQRLDALKIPRVVIQPLVLDASDVSTVKARGRYILSTLLPFLLLVMTITGAFYPAIDLTAGEKERGTLETLLTAPIKPLEIVAGKYLTVASIATITGGLNILSMWFTFAHGIRIAAGPALKGKISMGLDAVHMFAIMGFLLLVAAFAAAFMMAVASLARSFKEAQNFVTPAYLAVFFPIFITTLPGMKGSIETAILPLVNTSYAIRHTLRGTLTSQYLLITLISMGITIALTLYLASRIFAHEQVLFREGEYSLKGLFSTSGLAERPTASIPEVLFLLCVQFLLLFYIGISVQKANPSLGLVITLWGIILAPPLLFAWWRKIQFRTMLSLRSFSPITGFAVFLVVLGAMPWVVTLTQVILQFLPGAEEFARQMEKLFTPQHFNLSALTFFFLLSISPGICEEIMFRGFVQSAFLQRMKPITAIVWTSLLFGLYHLSIFRLFPTTVLGILLGWLCYRTRSIFPAMLAHAANNGLALYFSSTKAPKFLQTMVSSPTVVHLGLATVLLVGGIWLIDRFNPKIEETQSPGEPLFQRSVV